MKIRGGLIDFWPMHTDNDDGDFCCECARLIVDCHNRWHGS